LHLRVPRISENASVSQSARAEFHPALEPTNYVSLLKLRGHVGSETLEVIVVSRLRVVSFQCAPNLFVRELRPQVGTICCIPVTIDMPLVSVVNVPNGISCAHRATRIP